MRVQAGRLRAKLAEYYSSVGHDDLILVELPKGSYTLAFHPRPPEGAVRGAPVLPQGALQDEFTKPQTVRKLILINTLLSVLLVGSMAAVIALVAARKSHLSALPSVAAESTPAVFQVFWQPFLTGPEEPWVVFSNAAFVGRPETGMRYFKQLTDSSEHILDHYTGVGEVLAVSDLDHVFGMLKRGTRIKRGSLFTLDEAKNNDLIFVGSPAENLALRELPGTQEFVFQRVASGPRKGDLAISNIHPKRGESSIFLPNPQTPPLNEDYAIVALLHGLNPARSTLILAGTSTIGTQAAVEFVCQPNSLQELLRQLNVANASDLKPFEAVIHVKVARGVPVGTDLVALRKPLP